MNRAKKILQMCLATSSNPIMLPKWETTKGLSSENQNKVLQEWPSPESSSLQNHQVNEHETADLKSIESSSDKPLFSSDSEADPTYEPDSEFENTENLEDHSHKNYSLRKPLIRNHICNVGLPTTVGEDSYEKDASEYFNNISSPVDSSSKINSTSDHVSSVEQVAPCENGVDSTTSETENNSAYSPVVSQHIPSSSRGSKNSKKPYKKFKRTPDFCIYCDLEVQNFARHIQRNHSCETDVQKIFLMPANSLERKRAIANLRKKGNYIENSVKFFKPVHRSNINDVQENYLPCPFCFGSYSKKLLWKHKRICTAKTNLSNISLSQGKSCIIPNFGGDTDLQTKIFPRMHLDAVSLVAKKDPLICAFGSRYIKSHREQHHINVCSRKMRELAKVLMESKKIDNSITNLFDLLQPQYFDVVVQSVKVIAKYDSKTDVFKSPTFAMNISRTLKDCCDIAILHIIKRKHNYMSISAAEAEGNVQVFRRLLENMWRHEISSKAGSDLNTHTWNKVTMVPLAADLKIFRSYLIAKGQEAANQLENQIDNFKAFNLLMETVFCRLLLLNRRRVGELQRLTLATYMKTEGTEKNYEEFTEAISASEKILLKNFKRVVTRGKRGRGVPILVSGDLQDHLKLILRARPKFIKTQNVYLFANPSSDNNPITGYKVIQKHANLCGAKNPQALTSTRLRKHLATLTQVFSMTDNDVEQLATFMGHTVSVHKQVYRLPDDVYQTAKIAKLLLLMESGEAAKYKGKTLDEIELDMEDDVLNDNFGDMNNSLENDNIGDLDNDILTCQEKNSEEQKEKNDNPLKTKVKRRVLIPWTSKQKETAKHFFKNHIKNQKPPKQHECETLMADYPGLYDNKSWTKIKVFIQNIYTKKKKFDDD